LKKPEEGGLIQEIANASDNRILRIYKVMTKHVLAEDIYENEESIISFADLEKLYRPIHQPDEKGYFETVYEHSHWQVVYEPPKRSFFKKAWRRLCMRVGLIFKK